MGDVSPEMLTHHLMKNVFLGEHLGDKFQVYFPADFTLLLYMVLILNPTKCLHILCLYSFSRGPEVSKQIVLNVFFF